MKLITHLVDKLTCLTPVFLDSVHFEYTRQQNFLRHGSLVALIRRKLSLHFKKLLTNKIATFYSTSQERSLDMEYC